MAILARINQHIICYIKNHLLFRMRYGVHIKKKSKIRVSHYLDNRLIFFLNSSSRNDALSFLVNKLEEEGKINKKNQFFRAVLEREKVVSTGIGMGIAIPHAKMTDLKNFFIAIGVQKTKPLPWNSLDRLPVRFIFMIGGPEDRQEEYLQILSHLTQAIKDDVIRKKLLKMKTSHEVIDLFSSY